MQYDDWAARYDQDTQRFGWCAPQRVVEGVTDRVQLTPAMRVLDLGVGTGQCSAPFLAAGASVVGVDAAPRMLEQAAQRGPFEDLVELKLGRRPLSDAISGEPFDVVMACGVLHFVADLSALLVELRPLVREDGVVSISTIPPQPRTFGPTTHPTAPHDVAQWMRNAGFTVHHQSTFVAYYDQADQDDPVKYTLSVAT